MTNYRRNFIAGGSYFFTVTLADRSSRLLVEKVDLLKEAIHSVKTEKPFDTVAMVVMPEHLHCIWTLPPDDADYPTRWKMIKARFSSEIPKVEKRSESRISKGERGIWQRRFWEHTIRDEVDFQRHMDYIHFNPVKHSLVSRVIDWPYSTFHRCVSDGLYPVDWAGKVDGDGGFGE